MTFVALHTCIITFILSSFTFGTEENGPNTVPFCTPVRRAYHSKAIEGHRFSASRRKVSRDSKEFFERCPGLGPSPGRPGCRPLAQHSELGPGCWILRRADLRERRGHCGPRKAVLSLGHLVDSYAYSLGCAAVGSAHWRFGPCKNRDLPCRVAAFARR